MKLRGLGLLGCLGLVASVCLLTLPGCEDQPDKPRAPAHPFSGQTVTVAFPAGLGFGDSWRAALDEWSEQTGAKCKLAEYNRAAGGLKELPAGDVLVLPFADLPTISGRPTLVPISTPVLACYLRSDLLTKAGLKPPQTWDDYQTLLDTLPKWAPGLTAVEPWAPEFRSTVFLARALPDVMKPGNYSVYFDIDTGAPLIDSPGFARALETALAQVPKLSPDSLKLGPAECRRLVFTGKAAMALAFESGRADEKPTERAAGEFLTFVRLPGVRQMYDRQTKS